MNNSSQQSQPQPEAKPAKSKTFWVSMMATIIALVAIVVAGFAYEQLETAQKQLTSQHTAMNAQQQTLMDNVSQLQSNLQLTQQNVTTLMQKLGDSRDQSTLSQVAYLINLANLQLSVSHNAKTSLQMLMMAQQKVENLNDPRLYALNKVLLKDIDELKAVPKFNITHVISQIDALSDSITTANIIPNQQDLLQAQQKSGEAVSQADNQKDDKWYQRAWHHISGIKGLIIIRKTDPDMRPLMDVQQQALMKSTIQSKLMLAEYAAISHNNKLYHQHLDMVEKWIKTYFFDSITRKNLLAQCTQLQSIDVSPKVPDIGDTITVLNQTLRAVADSSPRYNSDSNASIPTKDQSSAPQKMEKKKSAPSVDESSPSHANPGVAI